MELVEPEYLVARRVLLEFFIKANAILKIDFQTDVEISDD